MKVQSSRAEIEALCGGPGGDPLYPGEAGGHGSFPHGWAVPVIVNSGGPSWGTTGDPRLQPNLLTLFAPVLASDRGVDGRPIVVSETSSAS